jgi:UDP-N-acetyl-2-amino-2-deoxyglucuronate dehydrogenase
MNRKISYGLIGCGKIADNHIKAAIKNNLDINFIADLNNERMNLFAQNHNLTNVSKVNDYRNILEKNVKVDFISIATDSGSHFKIAYDLIKNGYNVLIEKPIALSIEECDLLIEESLKKNILAAAIHPNRFVYSINKLKEAISNNEFGNLNHGSVKILLNRNEEYFNQAKWRGSWKFDGGGVLINQSIHNIDLLQWVMGSPIKNVYGKIKNQVHPYIQAEDLGLAILEFFNGSTATIEATNNVYSKNLEESLYVLGTNGTAKLSGKSLSKIEIWDTKINPKLSNPHHDLNIPLNYDLTNLHQPVFDDFIDSLIHKREPKVSLVEAKKSIEIILNIYYSSLKGQILTSPFTRIKSSDFEGKFLWK